MTVGSVTRPKRPCSTSSFGRAHWTGAPRASRLMPESRRNSLRERWSGSSRVSLTSTRARKGRFYAKRRARFGPLRVYVDECTDFGEIEKPLRIGDGQVVDSL